ncbi:hypothetical protein CEXT_552591 [Caerostris extrusa]|uniref:Uncharacterized protein n=1 Tax=Caerostris extrusa TaxID=172846 RepID=A0AAV4VSL0_CAEEX|nr:hypothetical protein CEXT_552591 [Caerostris extrusa]
MSSVRQSNTKHLVSTNFASKTSLKIIAERIGKQMLILTTRYTCPCQTSQQGVVLCVQTLILRDRTERVSELRKNEMFVRLSCPKHFCWTYWSLDDVQEEFIPADFEIDDTPFSEEDDMSASDVDDMDSLNDLLALDDLSFLDEEDEEV